MNTDLAAILIGTLVLVSLGAFIGLIVDRLAARITGFIKKHRDGGGSRGERAD